MLPVLRPQLFYITLVIYILTATSVMVIHSVNNRNLYENRINLTDISYHDPKLLSVLQNRYMEPPSTLKYNLMRNRTDRIADDYNAFRKGFPSFVRTKRILKNMFEGKGSGFFVEAGAMDGEFISNTLYLEEELNWKGLLIEPDKETYKKLLLKHRQSWTSNTCISTTNKPLVLPFKTYNLDNGPLAAKLLVRSTSNLHSVKGVIPPAGEIMGKPESVTKIQCFPLASYLLALEKQQIDYISLDVEGSESGILLNFPWESFNVTVWTIEHRIMGNHFQKYKTNEILDGMEDGFVEFMSSKGYEMADYWDGDYTFVKKHSNVWKLIKETT